MAFECFIKANTLSDKKICADKLIEDFLLIILLSPDFLKQELITSDNLYTFLMLIDNQEVFSLFVKEKEPPWFYFEAVKNSDDYIYLGIPYLKYLKKFKQEQHLNYFCFYDGGKIDFFDRDWSAIINWA